MRPKRCNACERQWFGSSNVCPNCGKLKQSRREAQPLLPDHPQLKNLLWVAAALALLIVLLKIN